MKKTKCNAILYIAMFLFAGIVVLLACRQSNQAIASIPLPLQFVGEYSQNGGEWKTLSRDTDLSGYDGDLVLRGRFNEELPEGTVIKCYMNHIGMSVYMDGEVVHQSSCEQFPEMCGKCWVSWEMPALATDGAIEIHLNNPHRYGNPEAYNEFLDDIYMSGDDILKDYCEKQSMPYRMMSAFIIVVSMALIGMAVGYLLMRMSYGSLLLKLGMMSMLIGVYIYMDTKDIFLRSNLMVFNTDVRQICMMFAAWLLGTSVVEFLKEKRQKLAQLAVYVLIGSDFLLLALSLAGVLGMYDTGMYWAVVQGIISLWLIVLCILEIRKGEKQHRMMQFSAILLLAVLCLELVNARLGLWQSGICMKTVFMVIFVFQLIRAVWLVVQNHQTSMKAEKLKAEIRNSRIVLAMSQIRTHFIFNVLNAISGMCTYDPKKADETLIMFSRYLRSNINIMDEDEPETFSRSMEHLEDYVRLEQVRFGDKIQFIKQLDAEDFLIPPLILQPVVENAIKHGLLPKREGGTVWLHTWTDERNHIIEISDDGVGFDTESVPREGSVGMKNVRFRLEYMVKGTMDIKSSPGKGTTVTITIPCTEEDRRETTQKK